MRLGLLAVAVVMTVGAGLLASGCGESEITVINVSIVISEADDGALVQATATEAVPLGQLSVGLEFSDDCVSDTFGRRNYLLGANLAPLTAMTPQIVTLPRPAEADYSECSLAEVQQVDVSILNWGGDHCAAEARSLGYSRWECRLEQTAD